MENFRIHFGEQTLLANIKYMDLESYRNQLREKRENPINVLKSLFVLENEHRTQKQNLLSTRLKRKRKVHLKGYTLL